MNSLSIRKAIATHGAVRILNPDALVKRCNRAMRKDGERVAACSTRSRSHDVLGDHYIVNADGDVVSRHVNLEYLARELGVLTDADLAPEPDTRSIEQIEAVVYEARERLSEAQGGAHERKLRAELADAEEALRRARAVGRAAA